MAQERIDFENTQWLKELRATLGDELVDVRCVREGEGYDFLLVYSPGNDEVVLDKFLGILRTDPMSPPFELMMFEAGNVPDYYGEYESIAPAAAHAE